MKTLSTLKKAAALLIASLFTTTAMGAVKSADRPATPAEKAALVKTLMSNPVIKAAYYDGKKTADSCKFTIDKATQQGAFEPGSSFRFEATITCADAGNEYDGGGIFYFVTIKGTSFGTLIDTLQINIGHAG